MKKKTRLKKWGSSLGVIVPADIIKKEKLKEGEEVFIDIRRKNNLEDLFGSLKGWKIDSQKVKDEARRDWDK